MLAYVFSRRSVGESDCTYRAVAKRDGDPDLRHVDVIDISLEVTGSVGNVLDLVDDRALFVWS